MECKKNNAGMTLVEIMVALTISIIFIGVLGSIYLSTSKYQGSYEERRLANSITDALFELTKDKLTYATAIEVSNSPDCPAGWEENKDKWSYIYFERKAEGGYLGYCIHMKDADGKLEEYDSPNIYGTGFYRKNSIAVSFELGDTDVKSLGIAMEAYNADDTLIYERNRTIDVINMTNSKSDIVIETGVRNNDNDRVYVHFRTDSQISLTGGTPGGSTNPSDTIVTNETDSAINEAVLYNGILAMYTAYTASYGDKVFVPDNGGNGELNYWSHESFYNIDNGYYMFNCNRLAMPLVSLYGIKYLGWGISQNLGDGSAAGDNLGVISKTTLTAKGVGELCGGDKLYYKAYHYGLTTSKCDILMYAGANREWVGFDNQKNGLRTLETNMVYDGTNWYYFVLGSTSGTGGRVTRLERLDSNGNVTGTLSLPEIQYNSKMKVTTAGGSEEIIEIDTATKVYEFFKKYGQVLY